ncbi:heme/hemin ABC transporter substrate-binding protein [Oricola thermophila]|nr:hemin ABC transporter substrate-binding protein [Oricola thermophila]
MVLLLLVTRNASADAQESPRRILSIGGAITEIVFALGEEGRLVGRDSTSTWPEEARELPDVGYMRALAPEGVLSIRPDLILASEGSGPPEAIDVLKAASIPYVEVPQEYDAEGIDAAIRIVSEALGVREKGDALRADLSEQITELSVAVAEIKQRKRVLFILSMQDGRIMASGTGTAADGILRLAGAENALTEFAGYKQLTDEALISADPDVVLMMDRGDGFTIDDEALFSHPGLKSTRAGRNRAFVRMDGLYLLGFGPRTAAAALDLAKALYGNDLR